LGAGYRGRWEHWRGISADPQLAKKVKYPKPIVDLKQTRLEVIKAFKANK